jgi:hypothetical protein
VRTDTILDNGVKKDYFGSQVKKFGGSRMKKLIISWVLPYVLNMLIEALMALSRKSSNDIDDQLVSVFGANIDKVEHEIRMRFL